MTCLLNSLEKMSEGKRKVFFYLSFAIGGVLTIGGFAGFATQHRGYAFIVVVLGNVCKIIIIMTHLNKMVSFESRKKKEKA